MKITLLYNTPADICPGLERVIKIGMDVLIELGLTVKEIDLRTNKLPYFDGKPNEEAGAIVRDIRGSSGMVFASVSKLPLTPAPFAVFLEYLSLPEYADALRDKNCFLLMASESGGERSALESLSRALQDLGAYDSIKAGLQRADIDKIDTLEDDRSVFERLMEDFYRVIRQNRQSFIPLDYPRIQVMDVTGNLDKINIKSDANNEKKHKLSIDELTQKLSLDTLNENQAEDINEISDYFNRIISEHHQTDNTSPVFVKTLNRDMTLANQNPSNCKQLTKSLTHHFQPQFSHNLNAVIQLQVSGEEAFSGYITIQNAECAYSDGSAQNSDITIIADSSVWHDVCAGKYSAQKAFMIGRLKVRGNFVLLTKFDHLFHLSR
ncbi:MAG: SCP2 sterol-binding domain-containing protein [Clostridiales bacterium]|jgi:putative sterol carrier protein/NAD(P)H-dependent FMN reductase|nr:SCP2 sterol-binding domain-containing protein [Clostridiales bacterium]